LARSSKARATDARKKLFAEHLMNFVPVMGLIRRVLDERPTHTAPTARFRSELEDYMAEDQADEVQRVAHDIEIVAARLRDEEALALAIEVLDGKFGFERLDRMVHCALCDARHLGGTRETPMPSRGFEGLQRWRPRAHRARPDSS
jgi:hypothetical protein